MAYAVVRVRGSVGVRGDIADTMKMLRLHRVNHCVIIPDTEHYTGMIKKVKDYVTYGEIDKDTLVALILKRGRLPGNKRLSEELVKELTELPVEELAEKVIAGEIKIKDTPIKPVFRLHPPRKGYDRAGVKKGFSIGGALGYRSGKINDLLNKMM
ncbi:50S ribosomal protein L30 [Methanococcus maripaludis]|jgi:large subunit ribosomal protein L30|uniref:Large ribosomal subunit protein uL30 n=4 Tax=Methanococcus maripaludis TaxID=39152 RepID=RL30_METMP|nr:50S ribosomal protein L30 [Methanococcus maripaludis]Q6LXD2.1 RecName: Full=Large ribosomal subunit protein uL30; AltName: Full=50S ribosomal protein L30 [Methanococcus maripaludis S2]AVB76797.1 50S ribosomal protein L30P [Methanococcus maripaludis]MBA2847319.1 large subunit ribosomal protein L30 [Methanococcus maripaludis]MBA2850176.1 large subunit ribosomal protein L30 [Methanococcus maripaludis]MBA2857609.1 large subunit ribosomal protein L30 [Methanococcus maripaludis]MBA2863307.1 larg